MILLLALTLPAGACGGKQPAPQSPKSSPTESCKDSDGPTAETVRQAIAAVPIAVPGSFWVEVARGHTKKCRLYWVQIIPTIAGESTPQQLLFFHHDIALGTPTPNPKPYITVLPPSDDTITVQYRWRVGQDEPCCPTGVGTAQFQVGSDGKLHALGKVPNQ